jgi:hypothetical protein
VHSAGPNPARGQRPIGCGGLLWQRAVTASRPEGAAQQPARRAPTLVTAHGAPGAAQSPTPTTAIIILCSKISRYMFWVQLRVGVCNVSKNSFRLQPTHSYSVWTWDSNLLLWYIYKIIYSLFHINQRQYFFWAQQKFQRRDSDLDQFWVTSKKFMSEFWWWSNLGPHQKIWHRDW